MSRLFDKLLNLDLKLSDEQIERYADGVMKTHNVNNSIKPLTREAVVALYKNNMQ